MSIQKKSTSHTKKKMPRSTDTQEEASLREYQTILAMAEEVAQIGSWKWDLRTQKVTWSDEMFRLFGVEREGFDGDVNRIVAERIHPQDAAAVAESNRRVLEEANPIPMSYRIVLPNGMERTVWAQGKLIRDEEGNPTALTGFIQDITERVRAEKKIIQMKRLYATLSQVNQMIVRIKDQAELYQMMCNVAVQFGEFPFAWVGLLDEASGEVRPVAAYGEELEHWKFPIVNLHNENHHDTLTVTALRTSQVVSTKDIQVDPRLELLRHTMPQAPYHGMAVIPFQLREKSIGVFILFSYEVNLFEQTDEINLLKEMSLDISFALDNMENEKERQQAEQKIAYQARLLENINDAVLATDAQFHITNWNQAAEALYGYKENEVLGKRSQEIIHSEFSDEQRASAVKDLQENGSYRVELLQYHRDGHSFWVDGSTFALRDQNGQVDGYISINRDITQRKQAEMQVLSLSKFPEENPNPVFRFGKDGTIQYANQSCQVLLQYWNCIVGSQLPADVQEVVFKTLEMGRANELEIACFDRIFAIVFAPITEGGYVNGYGREITQAKHAEEELRQSDERYRLISENSADVIWVLDPMAGKFKYVSPSVEKLRGYTPAEVMAQPVADALTPESLKLVSDALTTNLPGFIAKGSGTLINVNEVDQPRKDGSIVHTEVTTTYAFNQQGQVEIIGISRDITERKKVEKELRDARELFQEIFTTSPVPIALSRISDRSIVDINPAMEKLLGYTREEMVGQPSTNFDYWSVPQERQRAFEILLAEKSIHDYEFSFKTKSGMIGRALNYTEKIEQGGEAYLLSVFIDVTERKQVEEALKRNEHVLRLFVEHSPASIAMFDRDMKYIVASHRYLIDYRLPIQDLTGRSHYDVFPEIPERWKEIHRRCLTGAIEKAEEDPFPREDGTTDWVRWEIRPWYEEAGVIGGVILFSEVITERKLVQDELRLLNMKLEQRVAERTSELEHANRAKDEFLANMSHELRTPLNTVLGLSETLLEQHRGPLNEKQVQSLELISSSGRHLLGLINDILEVSKIEAGKLLLFPTTVSVKELCESSLNFIKEMALKKSIRVEFTNAENISTLYGDPQRLKQILINLLMNAVKFTPDGGKVSLDVFVNEEKEKAGFSVTDTGIGIAKDDLQKLFTPFTQLDSSLARSYSGTGLGLALVQKLTDLHGGSVYVESELGKGSRFTVYLPWKADAQSQTDPPALSTDRLRETVQGTSAIETPQGRQVILLAEDNEANIITIGEYLDASGYYIVVAHDGFEAIEKAKVINPDIILMDIQMPAMNGLEAMRILRTDARFTTTPIIALTALAMPGDRERCISAGADEYMSKPVSLRELAKTVARLLEVKML